MLSWLHNELYNKLCSNWLIVQEYITLFLWLLWTVLYSVQCQCATRYIVAMLSDVVSSQWLWHEEDLKQIQSHRHTILCCSYIDSK